MAMAFFAVYLLLTLTLLYTQWPRLLWEVASLLYLLTATFCIGLPWIALVLLWSIIPLLVLLIECPPLRNSFTHFLFKKAGKSIPPLSQTEEEALNAGDTWLEESIFRGQPDWTRLSNIATALTKEEQSFMDKEVKTLCELLQDWEIIQSQDLPPKVWTYLKENGFFGLVISKAFGGRGFSARAHSDIVVKIATRSGVAAVSVMVPNSLGPGELLTYYGTEEQKNYYLPRLAKGLDIPCFALTEPGAGSDATSIQSEGIVVKEKVGGKEVLGMRITFDKRWITLAPVATLIGLAVQLKDPEGLLKGVGSEGITCLLMPRDVAGLEIGNRHLPGNQPFMNGTLRGKNIFLPLSSIIGGQKEAGRGWQMLVECLSIGRSISLPALAAASSSVSYLTSGAYARIRKQFNVEIAQLEGIGEKLSEIAGLNYLINATRLLTVAAVNEHKKPSVASAITKCFNTELSRIVVNNALDIHAGRGVVEGPRNYLMSAYQSLPISITVEGANIMTRNLLIFGQGSMACHPFIRKEFYAVSRGDKKAFSKVIWQHIQYFIHNLAKTMISAWTRGLLIRVPASPMKREYQKLARLSYAYAWIADLSLIVLGGSLKRRERVSARLADGLSYLYMAMAALHEAELHAKEPGELIHAQWAVRYCFYKAQASLLALAKNFPARFIGFLIRLVAFPFGQTMHYPSDKLDKQLAESMASNNAYRDRLKKWVYLSGQPAEPLDKMEHALQLIIKTEDLSKKIKDLKRYRFGELREKIQEKLQKKELSAKEAETLLQVEAARWDAIMVDEFTLDSMKRKTFDSVAETIESPLM